MKMDRNAKVLVTGSRGLVGSAIVRKLRAEGFTNLLTPTSNSLNLVDQAAALKYLKRQRPDYVFCAAAKVGGIRANSDFPADFCYENLQMEANLIHGAYLAQTKKLLFLGSSCIYPKDSEIPIKESSLLTGPLEPTNEAYALAKIVGVKLCDYYRQQHGCDFISVMPTNTFGPHDNFDMSMGHMVPALIHKFYLAKQRGDDHVQVWGTGKPLRELIYVDDVADACLFAMENYSQAGVINAGSGQDISVREIAELIRKITGFEGELRFDLSKPDGVYRKVMDVSRFREMGWTPKVSIEDGLRRSYEWFVENYGEMAAHPLFKKPTLLIKSPRIAPKIKRLLLNPKIANKSLDDPDTTIAHRAIILEKPFLRKVYLSNYVDIIKTETSLAGTPGISLEIGSGGGFLKTLLPSLVTSDVTKYAHVDRVERAEALSFGDGELRAIYMTGVLHHLGKARAFFREAQRTLRDGGYVVMMEPHMSKFGRFFFKTLHHEGNDEQAQIWEFPQTGPLSDANTALPNIIFDRDFAQFQTEFPELKIVKRRYHTFLTYGLSGGVAFRFSAPGWTYPFFAALEAVLSPFMRSALGTMQTIILQKQASPSAARRG